ncbi:uncharacterized protein LOC131289430 [Anopheles ziemanni]|uniref:uncharacterized protein LOC131289430 n=1 Tax=Anopheles ziemanni TaxID=345580 RepID=UPI0026602C89|nr:uncharacterized protein LOC131289430 [Anopheles ziemanni]
MTTLLPTSQSTGVEAYEDMFKEITRKLYGDESAHGLYPHNTQVAQLAPGAPTAPPDGGERSFTTLTQIGYETTTVGSSGAGPEPAGASGASAASTAFGLAALMQNGFPPPGAILNPVNFPPGTSKTPTSEFLLLDISTPSGDTNRWHSQQQGAEQESWSTGKHSSSTYGGKSSYKKPKTEPQDAGLNIPSTADRTGKGGAQGGGPGSSASSAGTTPHAYKRYSCTTCPYTTDRRDLFTRHENIHKDEKPFQCYACLKPFNRADHVKKHFLRMHRELEYDIAKTRRCPPSTSGTSSGTGSSSANTNKASGNYYGHMSHSGNSGAVPTSTGTSATTSTTQQPMQLNIPSGSFTSSGVHSLNIPSHAHESVSGQHHITASGLNGGHSAGQLLQLHNLHHQQQQQQHNVHHSSITIKQEKGLASGGSSLNTSASSAGGSPDEKSFVKKIKGEKKFACTFCPWAGTDNWGLKRHLNTHTKPYVCLLCDYKAARSERLATHVLKVHNKKACGKCSFFAEDQAHLDAHLQEAHPHDPTKVGKLTGTGGGGGGSSNGNAATHHAAAAPNGNVLRNLGNAFTSNNLPTNIPTSGNGFGTGTSANGHYHTAAGHHAATGNVLTTSNAANLIDTINQHLASAVGQNGGATTGVTGSSLQQQQHHQQQHWMVKPHRKRNGPELLYSYLEADGSDSGDYARLLHMQAVGRNKASVTQDFHNAGGGDNGINGDHSSSDGHSNTAAIPLLVGSKADRMRNNEPQDGSKSAAPALAKASDNVALSLASLLGGDQLSFLQLLATAAVAHQQLQLHSSTGPYANAGGSSSSGVQQKKQQQPKPSKAATAAVYQPSPVAGASKGDRYGSMVSSPPATANTLPHPQPHPRPATANSTSSSSSSKHSSNSTNGTTMIIPIGAPTTAAYATGESGGGYKKRRLNGSSSSDKENLIHRKGHSGGVLHLPGAASDIIVNGGNAIVNGGGGSKVGHNHHHNHHHHNNNNSSTSNKNINDIFDKVYKKPQNSFAPAKQQQHGVLPPILRIAPPAAVEDDVVNPVVIETEGQQFSLTEFLKNHTEVSISTVGNGITTMESKAGDDGEDSGVSSSEVESTEKLPASIQVVPPKKRKSEGERNPRKQQQPRRFDDSDSGGDTVPLDLAPGEKPITPSVTVNITPADESVSEGKQKVPAKANSPELTETGSSDESCVSRLADIRDKHMTQLVSRRRCCRICQNRGLLDHLDNYHYHSKISLILHTRWRHSRTHPQEVHCRQCGSQFRQAYKLALHRRLTHHSASSAEGKKTTVPKKSNGTASGVGKRSNGKENLATNYGRRKQRRRKPRSRCFTPRRRK